MTRKTKLFKQFSIGCLTILLSGSLNTLAVFADATSVDTVSTQGIGETRVESAEKTTSANPDNFDQATTPETTNAKQPVISKSDDVAQVQADEDVRQAENAIPSPQAQKTSESKDMPTSQGDVTSDIPTVKVNQDDSVSSPPVLKGANANEGTPGLEYNDDYTQVTGYTGESKDVVIPEGVTRIGDFAFERKGLKTVKLPESLSIIGNSAFSENQLEQIEIPNRVTIMGEYALAGNKLTSIAIPNGVERIGIGLCIANKLTSLKLPESLKIIDDRAFQQNQITSVILPNGLTSIGLDAFSSNEITTVVLPESLTTIKERALRGNQLTTLTIPKSVTSIGKLAFADNKLTTLIIDNAATSIGGYAFCFNQLTTVSLGDSVTSIGDYAFGLNQLTTVSLGDSVTSIGDYAFLQNNLRSLIIPDTVTKIGADIAIYQLPTITLARRASYTQADLGILTHYKKDEPVELTSQTKGVTIDGDSVKLDPNFTDDQFIVQWSAWDKRHEGKVTVKLVDAVRGTITYLDGANRQELLPAKDTSSKVGGKFGWTTPELITGYTVDLAKSQILTKSDDVPQTRSLTYMMTLTQTATIEELINYLNQQPIGSTTTSVEISYVYTKTPNNTGQVTVKYLDEAGQSIAKDKGLTGAIGDKYQTEQLAIDGYTFKSVTGQSTGKYTKMPQTVTYVYTKKNKQPDDKVPDNKKPDNKVPDNKTPDNADADSKTPNKQKPENTQVGDQSSQNNSQANQQLDKQSSRDQKMLAKQNRHTIKDATANQLPKTGES